MVYDLNKVEKKFHEYLRTVLDEKEFRINEIKITEDLLQQQKAFYIPFGFISYFLAIEDEKPVLYANASSRMDLDLIVIVDENGYADYDIWEPDAHKDIWEKYCDCEDKVKRFDYDNDLIFINDIEK
jgi:hypothetical protein